MELRLLKYFLTVAREGGVNKAAEALHITQPTLSRQMAQLEDETGVKLFERGSRKIRLTSEGILLRRRAEEILALVDRTEKELIENDALVEGKIVFGCGELAAVKALRDMVIKFHTKYPAVEFEIFTATADLVKERMENRLVDIGVMLEPIDIDKFDFVRLEQKERSVVLMRADDPLTEKATVSPKDLEGREIILPSRGNVQNEFINGLGESFQKVKLICTSNFATNAAIMIEGGMGCMIAVEGAIPYWDEKKIAHRPLSPEVQLTSVLAWKRQQPFGAAAAKFIEFIKCFSGISET